MMTQTEKNFYQWLQAILKKKQYTVYIIFHLRCSNQSHRTLMSVNALLVHQLNNNKIYIIKNATLSYDFKDKGETNTTKHILSIT